MQKKYAKPTCIYVDLRVNMWYNPLDGSDKTQANTDHETQKRRMNMENTVNQNQQIFMEERQRKIAEMIAAEGSVAISKILEMFSVSYETARRDLETLEQKGLCKRTHGGAITPLPDSGQVSVRPPAPRDFAKLPAFPEYLAIAKKAAERIRENDSIYLTGGSLGHLMIRFLPTKFYYTVVVNSADLASDLRALKNADIYVIGGKMRQSGSMVDPTALENAAKFRFDLCFLTGGGLSASFGLSNGTGETAAFQREILKNSMRRVLLMPGKKVGRNGFIKVCDINEFDEIITDKTADSGALEEITNLGVPVVIAEEDE